MEGAADDQLRRQHLAVFLHAQLHAVPEAVVLSLAGEDLCFHLLVQLQTEEHHFGIAAGADAQSDAPDDAAVVPHALQEGHAGGQIILDGGLV